MATIIVTRKSLREYNAKKRFVANVCHAVNLFLVKNEPISIELRDGVTLSDAADALRNVAEILDTAGSVTREDEERDDADWWKDGSFDVDDEELLQKNLG